MLFYGRKMGESDEQNGGWFNEKSLNYCKNHIVSDIHVQWKQQFKSVLDILLLCPGYWVNNRACVFVFLLYSHLPYCVINHWKSRRTYRSVPVLIIVIILIKLACIV